MTLSQMREELAMQAAGYLAKAEDASDPKLKAALIGKAEATAKYCEALDVYIKPEPQA